jgi:hypothetical protein
MPTLRFLSRFHFCDSEIQKGKEKEWKGKTFPLLFAFLGQYQTFYLKFYYHEPSQPV